MQENQISHVFCTFLLLTEEDMASCSRAFRKPKNAEEERNLIENAIPKSTRAVTKWSVKLLVEWQNGRENKNPAIEPCAFTTDKSKVQRLDTDIATMTAESLNFWLIKFVEELCKENGEKYPPRSLYSIVCGIQRFLEDVNGTDAVRIMDKNEHR